jgi:uncharacterized membrane protein
MAKLSLWIMAAGYVLVGVAHFSHTGDFVKIVPPYLPCPIALVYISGFFEISLALATLFKSVRRACLLRHHCPSIRGPAREYLYAQLL